MPRREPGRISDYPLYRSIHAGVNDMFQNGLVGESRRRYHRSSRSPCVPYICP